MSAAVLVRSALKPIRRGSAFSPSKTGGTYGRRFPITFHTGNYLTSRLKSWGA